MLFVSVVDKNQKPLMPTTPWRASRWLASGKATGFWKKGIFCVRLNVEPSDRKVQQIVIGIDPGSKREGFSVKSNVHTFLNVLVNAVDWVSDGKKTQKIMRRNRRYRNTPCRQPRSNRSIDYEWLPPSTKARWQLKIRVVSWLRKLFPVSDYVVEDIKVTTRRGRRWNMSFGPLESGKQLFYEELRKLGNLVTKHGYETKQLRDALGLKKSSNKMRETFSSHNVDSWALANSIVGGHTKPDNTSIFRMIPLRFHRRQLHALQPSTGGIRRPYGGTMSLGLKRGSLVKHLKYGLCYLGGSSQGRLSLHSLETGKRLCYNAKKEDLKVLCFNSWRWYKVA